MANLLSKLRIDYSSLTMLQGITDKPKDETIILHQNLLKGFICSETELKQLEEKTYRHLRLREMMLKHSSQASLIVMSLPMPRQVKKLNFKRTKTHFKIVFPGNCLRTALYVLVGRSHI